MSDSDTDFEGANEYTGLMDGHVAGEVAADATVEKPGRKRKSHKKDQGDGYESQVASTVFDPTTFPYLSLYEINVILAQK